jgi:hypothetical protein
MPERNIITAVSILFTSVAHIAIIASCSIIKDALDLRSKVLVS